MGDGAPEVSVLCGGAEGPGRRPCAFDEEAESGGVGVVRVGGRCEGAAEGVVGERGGEGGE